MSASHQQPTSPRDSSPSSAANAFLLEGLYSATTDDDDDDMDFTPGLEDLDSDEEYEGAHVLLQWLRISKSALSVCKTTRANGKLSQMLLKNVLKASLASTLVETLRRK
jgi:hypothetical protein